MYLYISITFFEFWKCTFCQLELIDFQWLEDDADQESGSKLLPSSGPPLVLPLFQPCTMNIAGVDMKLTMDKQKARKAMLVNIIRFVCLRQLYVVLNYVCRSFSMHMNVWVNVLE